jgi:hypothetical protein
MAPTDGTVRLMPSSYADSYPPIVHAIIARKPRRVLDIGPGWGKYGLACREYVHDLDTIDAIEVVQGRMPTQPAIYNNVYIGDARDATETFYQDYDLVLIIDVIEHMPLTSGHALLAKIQRAGADVLVSTPTKFIAQHDETNPHEEHLSYWDWDEFSGHGIDVDTSTPDANIYILKGRR